MAHHQTASLTSSQQTPSTQSYSSIHTLDFTGDKNDVTTNAWTTGAVSSEFHLNQVDSFRFRTSLIEIVEELKLRRQNDVENEERTQVLIKEKHELERKIDLDAIKMKNLHEENNKNLTETKRKFEEKMRVLEEKTRQDSVQRDGMEKEMEAMRDALRKLQLSKYSLEKLLRDQERKIQVQSDSTEHHLQQLSGVEHKLQSFSTYCTKLVDSQERLDRQVKEAVKLNQTLKYVNEHQKCLIGRDREVISSLEVRLLEANRKVQDKPSVSTESQLTLDVAQLTQQLDGRKTEVETLEKEVEELKSRYNETLAKLQDAYTLIERHLANAASHRDEAGILRGEKGELEETCGALKVALDSTHTELDIQTSIHQQAVDQWSIQSAETAVEMERLKVDLDLSSTNCEQLEELNSNWAKHNLELSTSLQEAKAKLEVPKCNTEVQTSVSLFEVNDVSCQTSVEVVTVPSQTDTPITHPAHTQTYSPPLTTNHTQTACTPHQVAGTQTRVAAVANTGVIATTDMADRGVQTLPVRVYQDFRDIGKDTGDHTKETRDQSNGQIQLRNDLPNDQSVSTGKPDSCKNRIINSQRDDQQQIEQNTLRDHIDDKRIDNYNGNTSDVDKDIRDLKCTQAPTVDASATLVPDNTENRQNGSLPVDGNLSENHAQEFTKNSSYSSTVSGLSTKYEQVHKDVDGSQALSSFKYRPQTLSLEERMQGNCPHESAKKSSVDVSISATIVESDEDIIEIISPESPNNSSLVSPSSTKTMPILEAVQDKVIQDNPRIFSLISSYREYGQQAKEVEDNGSERCIQVSPRNSTMSLSLRKPRTQSKRSSFEDQRSSFQDVEESCMGTEKHNKTKGKFTLSSGKSGILFEGKTLLSAYMTSMTSGVESKQTSPEDVTNKRRTTSRSAAAGKETGHKSVTDGRQARYNYVAETIETRIDSAHKSGRTGRHLDKQMSSRDIMASRQTSLNNIKHPGQTESSGHGTTGQPGKLSPYSRYSAMFRPRVVCTEGRTQGGEFQDKGQVEDVLTDPGKNSDSVRGILKGVCERKVNIKSVRFIEGPPETKMIQECSGDQSLFSDGEEDVIDDQSSQFVSLEDFQTGADTSGAKKRKLE